MYPPRRPTKSSNRMVAAGCVALAFTFMMVPFYFRFTTPNLNQRETLTGSQRQRGMYMISGKDAGLDPDWDPINYRRSPGWRDAQKKQQHADAVPVEDNAPKNP